MMTEDAIARASDEQLEAAVNQELERDRPKNAYVRYLTARHYAGDDGALGLVGAAVDFFNPVEDVIFATDVMEDVIRAHADRPARAAPQVQPHDGAYLQR